MIGQVVHKLHPHFANEEELLHKLNDALAYAKLSGIDAAQASLNVENGFAVNVRDQDVETLEHHQDKGLDITVYCNQQTGSASTSDLSTAAIRSTVDKACAIARYVNPDPFAGLPEVELMAYHYPDLQLYHPWDINPAKAIELAIECEAIACEQDKRIRHESALISTYNSLIIYGNTHGFVGSYPLSSHTISCSVVAEDQQQMQRDFEYTNARRAGDLDSITFVAKQVAKKTLARLGARPIKTQQCPIIFYAPVAKSLLRHFVAAISGSQLYRHESFLQDCLNQPVFSNNIHIYQQPHLLAAMGSAAFDAEGVATHNMDYVVNGVLVQYVLGSYSARKLGMQTTGNAGGVYNLEINHQDINLTDLLRQMHRGLLVTELLGQGVNIITGDYSRGVMGFWVDHGEIMFPVEQVTIAGNLRDMLLKVVAVSNDVDLRGSVRTGSILIESMTVAGE